MIVVSIGSAKSGGEYLTREVCIYACSHGGKGRKKQNDGTKSVRLKGKAGLQ